MSSESKKLRKCIICNEVNRKKTLVNCPKQSSIEKLIEVCNERKACHDDDIELAYQRISACSTQENSQFVYHTECYKSLTNAKRIQQVKKRYKDAVERENSDDKENDAAISTRRRSNVFYNKKNCIICQIPGGKTHLVERLDMGELMLR